VQLPELILEGEDPLYTCQWSVIPSTVRFEKLRLKLKTVSHIGPVILRLIAEIPHKWFVILIIIFTYYFCIIHIIFIWFIIKKLIFT